MKFGFDFSEELLPLSSGLKEWSNVTKKEFHGVKFEKRTVYKSSHCVYVLTGGELEKLKLCQSRMLGRVIPSITQLEVF